MTERSDSPEQRGIRAETIVMVVVGALVLIALWFIVSQRQQELRASPTGFDGLEVWLDSEGLETQSFSGGWLLDEQSIGLLVVPLFDTALDEERSLPRTKEELLLQEDEYDLDTEPLLEKARRVPTLVVLPKWRSGMRLTGLGHPVLLVDRQGPEQIVRTLGTDRNPRIGYANRAFTDFPVAHGTDRTVRLYAAQMFDADGCAPVIGEKGAMVLAECLIHLGGARDHLYILSDPDLLNNHGLRLGQNAEVMRDLIGDWAGDDLVMIDYSRQNWLRDSSQMVLRERTWEDLRRFFEPPFLALWLGAGLALAFAIWRGGLRYGPVTSTAGRPGAAKTDAVEARARLMRLADQDGALLAEYARARIGAVAAALFGPAHARHYANEEVFVAYVERRHPGRGEALRGVLATLAGLPARIPAAEAIRHVDDLERILEQITHDT